MTRDLGPETVIDGRYRIERRIGSGGMADVYLASDLQLGREVAVKILHRRFAQDPEFVERFRREASNAAGLQHQHIVSVYDRGEWDGTYYIAMEYLQGRSLKQIIQDYGPLDPALAADLASQILRAERFAHRRGVVHRDIKPHNVIVDDDGLATVTDFGIARAGASDMTQTGSIMGTAQYLSPEQAQGQPVGPGSDLYSTGVVLYEMATGSLPFDGESAVAIAMKQVGEQPPAPRAVNPAVPPALEAVILKALEKDPARRFTSADEFIAALEAAQQGVFPDTAQVAVPVATPVAAGQTQAGMSGAALAASGQEQGDGEDGGPSRRWWIFVAAGVVAAATV
ncbi:MAG: protein kinase domain-containing protein, partial [Solirubrobacterales bacterium]